MRRIGRLLATRLWVVKENSLPSSIIIWQYFPWVSHWMLLGEFVAERRGVRMFRAYQTKRIARLRATAQALACSQNPSPAAPLAQARHRNLLASSGARQERVLLPDGLLLARGAPPWVAQRAAKGVNTYRRAAPRPAYASPGRSPARALIALLLNLLVSAASCPTTPTCPKSLSGQPSQALGIGLPKTTKHSCP